MITLHRVMPKGEGLPATHVQPAEIVCITELSAGCSVLLRCGLSFNVTESHDEVLAAVEAATARKLPPRMYP